MDDPLDGNVAAGALADVFVTDTTDGTTVCAGCGAHHHVGELVAYLGGPGVVLRCRSCLAVQVRIVRGGGRVRIDLTGARLLEIEVPDGT